MSSELLEALRQCSLGYHAHSGDVSCAAAALAATEAPATHCAADECGRPYSDHVGPGNVGHPFAATSPSPAPLDVAALVVSLNRRYNASEDQSFRAAISLAIGDVKEYARPPAAPHRGADGVGLHCYGCAARLSPTPATPDEPHA